MKTLILAAIRCSVMFTAVAALSLAYPAPVQAVPTTYQYTGNPFTQVAGPYSTSDFVTGMVTLAAPLPPNFNDTVTPTAFTFSDGVQTITNLNSTSFGFQFETGPTGAITAWQIVLDTANGSLGTFIIPQLALAEDFGILFPFRGFGFNTSTPGTWSTRTSVAEAGSTLSLMTLTLMALGLVARRFQRAAA